MKTLKTLAIGLCLMPLAATAQTNVKNTFDLLTGSTKAAIVQNHSLEKDPLTGDKEAQCDVYQFTLPKKQMQLVTDIEKAFLKDSENAYKYATGKCDKKSDSRSISLASGNNDAVVIGMEDGMNYVYACFLAPEDTTGNHRYAYAMEWKQTDADFIVGKLVVTYATTQRYRQENQAKSSGSFLENLTDIEGLEGLKERFGGGLNISRNGRITFGSARSWFETLTSYITAMSTADMASRRAFASKIYSHTKNLKDVDETDKKTAANVLKTLLEDKKRYDDAIIQELLTAAIGNLK